MSYSDIIKRHNTAKDIDKLIHKNEKEQKLRKIRYEFRQSCEHLFICTHKREEYLGTVEINDVREPKIIGMQYTVKCPICLDCQVFYYPISTSPPFLTDIFENAYEICVLLLDEDIDKANYILNETIKEFYLENEDELNQKLKNFSKQLEVVGYNIDVEKITINKK